MTIQTIPVPPALLPEMWPHALPLVERALAEGPRLMNAEHVLAFVQKNDMQLWLVIGDSLRAVLVTHIRQWPLQRVVEFVLVAGDGMDEWLEAADETIEAWARDAGCVAIHGGGFRRGWERALKPLGYAPAWSTVRKELS